jgi:hypothetical protein
MTSRAGESVSIVVASRRDPALLAATLRSLAPAAKRHGAHVVVARAGGRNSAGHASEALDGVEWVFAEEQSDIPRLRGAGLARSDSTLTLLTEDNCVVDANWADELLAGAAHADVVGGRMDNAQRHRAIDWGAFFAEYGFFAGAYPPRGGQLTAANVLYRDSVRSRVAEWMNAGLWENVVHARLRTEGVRVEYAPRAIVRQNLTYELRGFCGDRYVHGRDYARSRIAERAGSRIRGIASSLLLPALLTYRVARVAGPGRWTSFVRALPATVTFLGAWSVGEAIGYLTSNRSTSHRP